MEFKMHVDNSSWQAWINSLRNALRRKDGFLKQAFLVVWPDESKSHFDEESGPEGRWAQWKASTRKARLAHEIRTVSARQLAFRRTAFVRAGGKMLQVSGRLRQQTTLDPELVDLPNGLRVLSPTPYSGYLDEGTRVMQARPFMWLGEGAQDRLSDTFLNFLTLSGSLAD